MDNKFAQYRSILLNEEYNVTDAIEFIKTHHELCASVINTITMEYNRTALHYACMYGTIEIVKLILDVGADVSVCDEFGCTPLMVSVSFWQRRNIVRVSYNRNGIVKLLISAGADVNTHDEDGYTPLHSASIFGYMKIVRLLINAGADVNSIMITCNGRDELCERTPLYNAILCGGRTRIVKLLISAGADVNFYSVNGDTPIKCASFYSHTRIVKLLISAGADVNVGDEGWTAMYDASFNEVDKHRNARRLRIAKLLISAGADINLICELDGQKTPLHNIVSSTPNIDMVKLLLNAGANVNIVNKKGETPLHTALRWYCNIDAIKLLLNATMY
jgi:uncharacterized protein